MRNVQFQEVGMENFGPYIDPMLLTFENDKLTLLTGKNGVGKTMSLDAIPFTMYGITTKKAKGDDVVNNVVGRNCKTWVKFMINEDQYLVTRYHKYTKLGNTVILNKNGVDIKQGHREVLPEIERLLCSQKAFMNTLMFGQKVKDFFTDLVDSDKKEIFRKILSLEQYQVYYKKTDENLKLLKQLRDELIKQQGINEGLLVDASEQIEIIKKAKRQFYIDKQFDIEELNKSLNDNERLLKKWNDNLQDSQVNDINLEQIIKELNQIENEISAQREQTSVKFNELKQQKEMKILELKASANKNKMKINNEVSGKNQKLQNEKMELQTEINQLTIINTDEKHNIELKIQNYKVKIVELENRISEIKNNVLDQDFSSCPLCEQEVTEVTKTNLITKSEDFSREIDLYKNNIIVLQTEYKLLLLELKKDTEVLNINITKIDSKSAEWVKYEESKYSEIEIRLKSATFKVNELLNKKEQQLINKGSKNKKELEEKQQILSNKKEDQETELEKIAEIEKTISNINQQINIIQGKIEYKKEEKYDATQLDSYLKKQRDLGIAIEENIKQLIKTDRQITIHDFWKVGFSSSGLPSILIDDSIPFMNEKIAEYLELITNGRYIVSFDTLDETKAGDFRDKISVRVVDTYTQANSRVQLSGGQTRIIDIATILTLGDLQSNIQDVKFNILLFDEIFDALDDDNANYVSKVLNKLKLGRSIYVISHQHQDQLEPDETLTLN